MCVGVCAVSYTHLNYNHNHNSDYYKQHTQQTRNNSYINATTAKVSLTQTNKQGVRQEKERSSEREREYVCVHAVKMNNSPNRELEAGIAGQSASQRQ